MEPRRRRSWQSASFDAETNTIIVGAGNPGPWNTWARTAKGGNPHDYDSLYTSGQVGWTRAAAR